MTPQEREGIWLPALGIALLLGFAAFCITAFYTMDWRLLISAAACWLILSAKGR